MNLLQSILDWFDIRREEFRAVVLSFLGAFFVIAFMILAKSLREGLYLGSFDAKTLPYIIVTVALLGLPAVGFFSKAMSRWSAQGVVRTALLVEVLGLLALWPWVAGGGSAVVVLYLWTALGTIVLTSGFWIVVSEHFPLRGAKRLYGLISAGGTAGAMVMGTGLGVLSRSLGTQALVLVLVGTLAVFLGVLLLFPVPVTDRGKSKSKTEEKKGLFDGIAQVARHRHLRIIAFIVATATLASVLLDYQFKDMVQSHIATKTGMTGFFGAFYGWTGAASLLAQLILTSRLLSRGGIGWTLAVLPMGLFLGSLSLLIIPGFALVVGVRGFDNSLRKSLHRSALEVLYVPLPERLRRKTKTFIDSTVDSLAEGMGALMIFLWVTLAGFSSRWLSVGVLVASGGILYLAYRMNREYFITLVDRLKGEKGTPPGSVVAGALDQDLLSLSFSQLDLQKSLADRGIVFQTAEPSPSLPEEKQATPGPRDLATLLNASDPREVSLALNQIESWRDIHVPYLIRLLANRNFRLTAERILRDMKETSLSPMIDFLREESNDFVIRRRLPRVLADMEFPEAEEALLEALSADRFEIRYRAAAALLKRRKKGLAHGRKESVPKVWAAIRFEINRERPIWEIQRLLDETEEAPGDDFVHKQAGMRGELSLEHTFRLLALILDPVAVRTAFHGILHGDEKMKSISLEYLEQVLPKDVRDKLWPFIGDISEARLRKSRRPLDDVVGELLLTGRTLFGDPESRQKLKEVLKKINGSET